MQSRTLKTRMHMRIRRAVIPAAGQGIRFLPITQYLPKEMLPLVVKPLIQYSLEVAIGCGIEKVAIVVRSDKKSIEDYFGQSFQLGQTLGNRTGLKRTKKLQGLELTYVQQQQPLGLGHAVLTTAKVIGEEPFILLLPDDIFERGVLEIRRMMKIQQFYQSSVIAVRSVSEKEVSRYGIIDGKKIDDRIYRVNSLVEKPRMNKAPSHLAIMGAYILTPQIFEALQKTHPGKHGEIQLTDALEILLQHQSLYAYEFEGERYDVGTIAGWLKTQVALALKDPDIGPEFRCYVKNILNRPSSGTDLFDLE